jgi:quercetin dioxygenase-like cupin family protein
MVVTKAGNSNGRKVVAKVNIVRPGEGEILGSGAQQIRILENGEHTDHRLGFAEVTIPPGTPSPLQHRHAQHDEGFYVVSGTVHFTIAEATHVAPAGTLAMIPPGAPHTFANLGDEPAVMLNTFTPDLYVQYFRDLRDMIAGGQELTPDATIKAMSRYATVPATDFA